MCQDVLGKVHSYNTFRVIFAIRSVIEIVGEGDADLARVEEDIWLSDHHRLNLLVFNGLLVPSPTADIVAHEWGWISNARRHFEAVYIWLLPRKW